MKNLFTATWVSLVLALSLSFETQASDLSFSSSCSEITKCIKKVSEITGDQYIFDYDVKGKIDSTENVLLTQENATLLLTHALNNSGFTRVPMSESGIYHILRKRDALDTLLPKVFATAESEPQWPKNWDLYHLVYQTKNLEVPEVLDEMARMARFFANPTTRIMPIEINGQILITAPIPDLKNIYHVIRGMDRKPTKVLLDKWKKSKATGRPMNQSVNSTKN